MAPKHTVIRGNKANYQPSNLIFVDTETRAVQPRPECKYRTHQFRLGCFRYGVWRRGKLTRQRSGFFTDVNVFWDFVDSRMRPKDTIWLIAHGAGFDMTALGLWDRLNSGQYHLTRPRQPKRGSKLDTQTDEVPTGMLVVEDPPTIIMLESSTGGRINIVDSLNYYRMPLKQLGELVDLPKLDMPDPADYDSTWIRYWQRDVEILERAFCHLLRWTKDHDLGNFAYTLPSQSWNAYRHRFMPVKLLPTLDPEEKAIARAGYFGGQTEVFKLGKITQPAFLLDVQSLFPAVMARNYYPVKSVDSCTIDRQSTIPPPYDLKSCICEVDINSQDVPYPYRRDNKILWATGTFTTSLVGPELARAAELGHITSYRRWVAYRMASIFTDFVAYFGHVKQAAERAGNQVERELAKLILNSLYGKFGQLGGGMQLEPNKIPATDWGKWVEIHAETNTQTEWLHIAGYAFRQLPRSEKKNSMPEISAFVCSYAREHMRHLREIAGHDSVYYQAIDSLIVDMYGFQNLVKSGEIDAQTIGKLREQVRADSAEIQGIGWYQIGNRKVEMGLKQDAHPVQRELWQVNRFSSLKSTLAGDPREGIREQLWVRAGCGQYSKGTIGRDGWIKPHYVDDVSPLRVENCSGNSMN